MNIQTLRSHTLTFRREVIDSGFRRDLSDFVASLPANKANSPALREMAGKVRDRLREMYDGDLPEVLAQLLPSNSPRPFTATAHDEDFEALLDDTGVELSEFFQRLNELLDRLKTEVEANDRAVDSIEDFISPYVAADETDLAEAGIATLSIILRDDAATSRLKTFQKELYRWHTTLPMYHHLLTSESPEEIQLVGVQDGSIDILVNLSIDIAVNLAEVFKYSFLLVGAYLAYARQNQPAIDGFRGNRKVRSLEEQMEEAMLEGIGEQVREKIREQHEAAREADTKVSKESVEGKIDAVAELVVYHIVHGNDVRLVGLPAPTDQENDNDEAEETREGLRIESLKARREFDRIPPDTKTKLLQTYDVPDDDDDDSVEES